VRPPVGHGHHVHALRHQHLEDGVGSHCPGGGHRDGAYPGYLTGLPGLRVAPHQGGVIDPHVHHGPGASPGVARRS
jgi:hypothetical protein